MIMASLCSNDNRGRGLRVDDMAHSQRQLVKRRKPQPKLLGVLLCYNDGDLLAESITYLLEQDHDVIAWDHGSDDSTKEVLHSFRKELREIRHLPREFDFYDLYPSMSKNLLDNYVHRYDWISWPDQDEFLEGPDRTKSYRDWIFELVDSDYDWVQFHNFNFWWTPDDDPSLECTRERVRHYSLFPDCAPRRRSWRATSTNERVFNHNPPLGKGSPEFFNLCHYPMRSETQMLRRLRRDRIGLRRGGSNSHYETMSSREEKLRIKSEQLHLDLGGELRKDVCFRWDELYFENS
jgi:glycosyltransferase involved in cell wall biosynthesis